MNGKLVNIIGGLATVAGLIATVVGNWASERQMETMVNEAVDERFKKILAKETENKEEDENEKDEEG